MNVHAFVTSVKTVIFKPHPSAPATWLHVSWLILTRLLPWRGINLPYIIRNHQVYCQHFIGFLVRRPVTGKLLVSAFADKSLKQFYCLNESITSTYVWLLMCNPNINKPPSPTPFLYWHVPILIWPLCSPHRVDARNAWHVHVLLYSDWCRLALNSSSATYWLLTWSFIIG